MATRRTPARLPYLVVGQMVSAGRVETSWVATRRVRLADALDDVRAHTSAWQRLIGAQASPLRWVVIDRRDGTTYRPGLATTKGWINGTDEEGRRYHADREPGRLDVA